MYRRALLLSSNLKIMGLQQHKSMFWSRNSHSPSGPVQHSWWPDAGSFPFPAPGSRRFLVWGAGAALWCQKRRLNSRDGTSCLWSAAARSKGDNECEYNALLFLEFPGSVHLITRHNSPRTRSSVWFFLNPASRSHSALCDLWHMIALQYLGVIFLLSFSWQGFQACPGEHPCLSSVCCCYLFIGSPTVCGPTWAITTRLVHLQAAPGNACPACL